MSSRIEQLIDEIQDYVESCKYQPFSNTKIVVDRDQLMSLIEELRMKTPEEIKRYAKIVSNKEAILNDARAKAQQLIDDATVKTNELISEHEIMQRAYQQAQEYVNMAAQKAQKILDDAAVEANGMREDTMKYAENMLRNMDLIIDHAIQVEKEQSEAYMTSMLECSQIVKANLNELCPTPETYGMDSDDLLLEDEDK